MKKIKNKKIRLQHKGFFWEIFEKRNWGFKLSSLDLENLFLHTTKQHQDCKIDKLSDLSYFHLMLNPSLDATQWCNIKKLKK
jgi:hypothetical protein